MRSTIPPRKKWLWVAGVICVLIACCLAFRTKIPPAPLPRELVVARVEIGPVDDKGALEFVIRDKELIADIVIAPINEAIDDPAPKFYTYVGAIVLQYSDGSTEELSLFRPFGHFKRGHKYLIADLSALKKRLEAYIGLASHFLPAPSN